MPGLLRTLSDLALGREPRLRRRVRALLLSSQLYLLGLAVLTHAVWLGVVEPVVAWRVAGVSAASFLLFYALVRSGWSQRLRDPLLALPHCLVSLAVSVFTYMQLDATRGDVFLLMAQTMVFAMLRLPPRQMVTVGCYVVGLLGLACWGLTWFDPVRHPAQVSWLHFGLGGTTLLTLSFVAKWIGQIRVRLENQARELKATLEQARMLATTDRLTGLLNRHSLQEEAAPLLNASEALMSVALLDVDHFKRVNDHYGHRVGDLVLQALAGVMKAQTRDGDLLARWGGEEFLVVLPGSDAQRALEVVERLRLAFAETRTDAGAAGTACATLSAGVAQRRPGESLDAWVDRADQALYEAKRNGRNRSLAEPPLQDAEPRAAGAGQVAITRCVPCGPAPGWV